MEQPTRSPVPARKGVIKCPAFPRPRFNCSFLFLRLVVFSSLYLAHLAVGLPQHSSRYPFTRAVSSTPSPIVFNTLPRPGVPFRRRLFPDLGRRTKNPIFLAQGLFSPFSSSFLFRPRRAHAALFTPDSRQRFYAISCLTCAACERGERGSNRFTILANEFSKVAGGLLPRLSLISSPPKAKVPLSLSPFVPRAIQHISPLNRPYFNPHRSSNTENFA